MRRPTSPISVFQAVVDAIDREDWQAVASACDPVSLARFKRNILERLEPGEPLRPFTVEGYMRGQPEMPRAVAEYQVARHNQAMDPARFLQEEMPTVSGIQEIHDSSDADVFAAWLEGKSRTHQIRRMMLHGSISQEEAALLDASAFPSMRHILIGAVPDGEKLTHVLYRTEIESPTPATEEDPRQRQAKLDPDERALLQDLAGRELPQVATCRIQPDGGWRMIAADHFLSLGNLAIGFSSSDEGESLDAADGS